MARTRPEDRLERLVESAIEVFLDVGYRRAQVADIARALGVAPGTLYLYVESKEALFDLALRRAAGETLDEAPKLPMPTPPPGTILEWVRVRAIEPTSLPTLTAALSGEPAADIRAEFEAIIRELYRRIYKRRRAIQLLERSAHDWPELAAVYYREGRRGLIQRLTDYLERRIAQKRLRPVPDMPTAARLILETVAWFALHRHGDADSAMIRDDLAEETVVDALVHAYLPN